MNKNPIYVCFAQNKHSLPAAILEQLQKIIKKTRQKVVYIDSEIFSFKGNEFKPILGDSVWGKDVLLVATLEENINIEAMKCFFYVDALRRSGAASIQLLMPYFYYERQDQTGDNREPISAAVIINTLEMLGVKHFITVHLHNPAIEGFASCPMDKIGTQKLFWNNLIDYCTRTEGYFDPKEWMLIFPDEGAAKQCRKYAKRVGTTQAGFSKNRVRPNEVESMDLFGNVKGFRCLLYDDIGDTGGTIATAAGMLMEAEAKDVFAACTHPLLNGKAPEVLQNSALKKIFVTDTVHIPDDKKFEKLEIVSAASMLASVILKRHNGESVRIENW